MTRIEFLEEGIKKVKEEIKNREYKIIIMKRMLAKEQNKIINKIERR